jgi:hypothetical protein
MLEVQLTTPVEGLKLELESRVSNHQIHNQRSVSLQNVVFDEFCEEGAWGQPR